MPALAAYAAIAPAAFPALGAATVSTPKCLAIETAADMPRALKLPVGVHALVLHVPPFTQSRLHGEVASSLRPVRSDSQGGKQPRRYRHAW